MSILVDEITNIQWTVFYDAYKAEVFRSLGKQDDDISS